MKVHRLKTWPDYFRPVMRGEKTFEIRKNDRGFAVGDVLLLEEYEQFSDGRGQYTGQRAAVDVTYIVADSSWNLPGFVVMSIQLRDRCRACAPSPTRTCIRCAGCWSCCECGHDEVARFRAAHPELTTFGEGTR